MAENVLTTKELKKKNRKAIKKDVQSYIYELVVGIDTLAEIVAENSLRAAILRVAVNSLIDLALELQEEN